MHQLTVEYDFTFFESVENENARKKVYEQDGGNDCLKKFLPEDRIKHKTRWLVLIALSSLDKLDGTFIYLISNDEEDETDQEWEIEAS